MQTLSSISCILRRSLTEIIQLNWKNQLRIQFRKSSSVLQRANEWVNLDPNAETKNEIQQLIDANDLDALDKKFQGRIAFGTAGLRGKMSAGPL